MSQKFRNVAFTLNNYTDDDINSLKTCEKFSYIIFGKEVCPTTGTPHLQGYCELKSQMRLSGLKKINNRAHWKERYEHATAEDNAEYCSKSGDVFTRGTPKKQGERKDLQQVANDIVEGKTDLDTLAQEDPALFCKYYKAWERCEYVKLRRMKRSWQTQGLWIYGETGTGKSHMCFDAILGKVPENDIFVWCNKNGWWDGYKGHPIVVINDLHTGEIEYGTILNLVDKWPYKVPVRGKEAIPFLARLVIVTSPMKAENCRFDRQFNSEDSQDQLLRRFKQINLSQKWSGNTIQTTQYSEMLKEAMEIYHKAMGESKE